MFIEFDNTIYNLNKFDSFSKAKDKIFFHKDGDDYETIKASPEQIDAYWFRLLRITKSDH